MQIIQNNKSTVFINSFLWADHKRINEFIKLNLSLTLEREYDENLFFYHLYLQKTLRLQISKNHNFYLVYLIKTSSWKWYNFNVIVFVRRKRKGVLSHSLSLWPASSNPLITHNFDRVIDNTNDPKHKIDRFHIRLRKQAIRD